MASLSRQKYLLIGAVHTKIKSLLEGLTVLGQLVVCDSVILQISVDT